jgi:hypothetical protein
MNRLKLTLSLTMLVWAATANPAWSQEARATLGGRVTDPQGAVIPSAVIVVTSDATGVEQRTKTNEQGNWAVRFLVPGSYSFSVIAAGFQRMDQKGIVLQTADDKLVDTRLAVGAAVEQISVTAGTPLIDTTSASSGTVITPEEILEMPSSSRESTLLATLSPGVVQQDQNNNPIHLWSYLAGSQMTADGGRNNTRSNEFELDGMPNVKSGGNVGFMPPPDAIQEFRVQMNAYDASIGRQAGATFQMSIKSGTAEYHGSLYEFNQNNLLNANLFQTNLQGGPRPPIHQNEYGGTLGGPVRIPKVYNGKQKSFFFVSYTRFKDSEPRFSIRSVPTALERQGDFSQSFTTQTINGQRVRYPIQVYDPFSVDASGNRQLFPGMLIPASRQSPIAQKILSYVALPNTASDPSGNALNNYVPAGSQLDTMPILTMRFDQMWNNAHKSFANIRSYHETGIGTSDFHNISTGNVGQRISKGIGLDHVWTKSSTAVLDLRFNLTRYEEPGIDNGSGFNPTQLGFPQSFVSQMEQPSFPYITGFAGVTTDNPQHFGTGDAGSYTDTSYYTWSAVMTQVKGNMTLKYGGEAWVLQQAGKAIGNQGQFDFGTNWTRQNAIVGGGTGNGSTVAAFLLGLPQGGSFPRNANSFYSQHYFAVHVEDDWRVTPKLTLNLGLRWDVETPVTERYNRLSSYFDINAINPISSPAQAAYAQILASNAGNAVVQQLAQLVPASEFIVRGAQRFAGVDGQTRGVFNTDWKQFQPRVGFAYRLTPHTVFRGGAGRFTQASFETAKQNGFSRSTSFIATQDNFFTPYDTLADPFRGGILAPTGSSLGPLTNLGQTVTWLNQNASHFYSWEYSLHLQHQIKGWLFEAGYTHNKTYNIWWDLNENLSSFALWQQLRPPQFDAAGRPVDTLTWDQLVPNPFYQLPGVTGSIASSKNIAFNQLLNPVKILGTITENDNPWGKNQYDALLAKMEHRFTRGFSVINSFTWSKLFEDTAWVGPEIAGRHIEHKLGGEDRPFHLSIAPIWQIPVGRRQKLWSGMPKVANVVLGGWQLSGQFNIQSGVPVVFGTDSFFSGKDFTLPHDKQSLNAWFDTSQFIPFPSKNADISNYPAWTGIQNLPGYNYKPASSDSIKNGVYQDFATFVRTYPTRWGDVRASRVNNLDAGLFKNFQIRERIKLQYRFEAFNVFNHVRFPAPDTNPGSATFGRVTLNQQNQPRQVQMALKLTF